MTDGITCKACSAEVDPLAVFPGRICLSCYEASAQGRAPLTADQIVSMWGGPVRKR